MANLLTSIQQKDLRWFEQLQRNRGLVARHSRNISRSADGPMYLSVAACSYFLERGSDYSLFWLLFVCFTIERSIYFVLKNTCRRRRPPQAIPGFRSQIVASDKFSFPSGHTSAAFMFATCCVLYFGPLAMLLFVWATMVGLSRILLGVHFPTDVLIGACLGTLIAAQTYIVLL